MNASRIVRERFALVTPSGHTIHGDMHSPAAASPAPVVVVCHSFMAFKDWGFFPYVAEKLAEAGYVSVTFNFSHNGVVEHENRITDFLAFEGNTFRQELHDVTSVIDAVTKGTIGRTLIDPERVALLGHSRGGGIAIVHTASDPRICALVTWSAISTFDRWTDHQKMRWRTRGFLPLAKDSAASPLRLGVKLLDELEQHEDELDIVAAARTVHVPWLIIHGKADVTVQVREAETLYRAANQSTTQCVLLDSVGHLYNAASRAEDNYRTLDSILERTVQWLHLHLS